jgi:hypothetical protein
LTELPGHTCAPVVARIEYDDHGRWERNSNRGRPYRTQAARQRRKLVVRWHDNRHPGMC